MGEDRAMEVKRITRRRIFLAAVLVGVILFFLLLAFFTFFSFLYIVHIIIVTDEIMMRSRETELKWSMEHNTVMMHYLWCT